jgi:hypothetical protein
LGDYFYRHGFENGEINQSVAFYFFLAAAQDDADIPVEIMKMTSDGKTVSAVISRSAENDDFFVLQTAECFRKNLHARPSCIFHEDDRRHSIFFNSQLVDEADLFAG